MQGRRRQGKTSLKKWICGFSIFIRIIPTHLLWQMNASSPSEKEREFCRCLFTSSVKHEIRHFHVPSRGRGKEMYEKARCTCKVVVLLITYCVFYVLVAFAGNVLYSSHQLLKANPSSASHNKVLNQPNSWKGKLCALLRVAKNVGIMQRSPHPKIPRQNVALVLPVEAILASLMRTKHCIFVFVLFLFYF